MKLIQKYFFTEFFRPFFACFILFIFLYWIIDLFDNLNEFVRAKIPLFVLCDYYFSLTPFIFVNISPIVVLLATIYTLTTFNRHNEITALKAIGINLWSITWIFLFVGILMSALSFVAAEMVMPESYLHAIDLKDEYFTQYSQKERDRIISNITFYGSRNSLYVIGSYDVNRQMMHNITISEHNRKNELIKKITAKRAQWVDNHWRFYGCIITEYDKGTITGAPKYFEETPLNIEEKPRNIKRADIQPALMGYWRLKKHIQRLNNYGFPAVKEHIDLYSKAAFPLANTIIVFFAVPFSLSRRRGGGQFLGITMSVLVSFGYWVINAVSIALGKNGIIPPLISAWLANIIFLFIGTAMIEAVQK